MRILYRYIKSHFQRDFHAPYYLSVLLFLAVCMFLNYYFRLEKEYLDPQFGKVSHFFTVIGSFLFAYVGTLAIRAIWRPEVLRQPWKFWIALVFGFSLVAHDMSFIWYRKVADWFPNDMYLLAIRTVKNILSITNVLLPIYIFHRITRDSSRYYGLTLKGFQWKPYTQISLIALFFIGIAAFNSDLGSYYPTYKPSMGDHFPGSEWIAVSIYEFFYAFDFISVEMVFRGFLVIGLSRWLGEEAIIPMVSAYCFLHFGKPLPEAISSIAGGYALGIFAFYSKNIMGGVLLHVSVALGMEFFAWALG